jgi:ABC-type nitrate/sulfonate/bicarbonate transport system permease component
MKVLTRRAHAPRLLLAVIMFMLLPAAWQASTAGQARPAAMTAECHQAYRGYMEATDAAEADFWAESWMTFGCETGGGYWA